MHKFGRILFDPDRLLFHRDDLDSAAIAEIHAHVEADNDYESVRRMLNDYDADAIRLRPGALNSAGICLTNNCNFRCGYCSASSLDGNAEPIRLEDVLTFVSDVMKRWTVGKLFGKSDEPLRLDFTGGGEPTYGWDLFREAVTGIKQRASQNGIPLSLGITTNGVLDCAKTNFIASHLQSAMVSYDGCPAIQDRNRRSVSNHHTSRAVEETIVRLSRVEGLRLTVRTTIWQDDFDHMKEMADYIFCNFGPSIEWSILPVILAGRALVHARSGRAQLNRHDFLERFLETVEHARQKYGSVEITTPIFRGEITSVYCGAISPFCSCPWLLPDKSIITCIESCEIKTVIGRIDDGRVEYFDKCHDPLFQMYQEKFDDCRDCLAYRFCRGGCPVRHLTNRENSAEMGDWECSIIRNYWEYVFTGVLDGQQRLGWSAIPIDIAGVKRNDVLKLVRMEGTPE